MKNNTQDFALLYKEKCTELADFKIEHQEMIGTSLKPYFCKD